MDIEEVKKRLTARIKRLEKQLEFYRTLLELLESGCEPAAAILEEIRDEDGNLIARLYKTPRGLQARVSAPISTSNIYIRHLARRLERLKKEGVEIEYSIRAGDDGRLELIEIEGALHEDLIEEIVRLLRFALTRAAAREAKG